MFGQDLVNLQTFAITIVLGCMWVCWRHLRTGTVKYPPGPPPLPIIGNLHLLAGKDSREVFDSFRAEYGDIFTVYFGRKPYIVVCGFNLMKEVLQINGDKFLGRPKALMGRENRKVRSSGPEDNYVMPGTVTDFSGRDNSAQRSIQTYFETPMALIAILGRSYEEVKNEILKLQQTRSKSYRFSMYPLTTKYSTGILRSDGKTWTEQRRFTISTLRDMGMGRDVLASRVLEEMDFLHVALDKYAESGKPINPSWLMNGAISNAINFMLFGKRFEYDDKDFLEVHEISKEILQLTSMVGLVDSIPILKYFPGDLFRVKRITTLLKNYRRMQIKFINSVTPCSEESTHDSFVSAYKRQLRKVKDDPNTSFNDDQMANVVGDLFTAASETTHTTIMWIFLYLLHYPEVQQRMWEEIRDNIGVDRKPAMSDRQNVPFVEAVLLEGLRHSDMGPITPPRCTLENTWVGKYFFPAGSRVLTYMHSISTDKQHWGDPENFRPLRFLDENGHFHKPEHAAFFSVGKRNCLGESFAKMNLFLTITSLLQRYEFLSPDGEPVPALKGEFTVTNHALPYRVELKLRNPQ